jgi:hypothetical protein
VCGKRLKVMIPALLPALERHGRLTLSGNERALTGKVQRAQLRKRGVGPTSWDSERAIQLT